MYVCVRNKNAREVKLNASHVVLQKVTKLIFDIIEGYEAYCCRMLIKTEQISMLDDIKND